MMKDHMKGTTQGCSIQTARNVEDIEKMRGVWEEMQWHPNADIDFYLTIVNSRQEILRPHVILLSLNGRPKAMMVGKLEERRLYFKIGYKALYCPNVRSLTIVEGGLLGDLCYHNADILVSELIDCLDRKEADIVFLSNLHIGSDLYKLAHTKPSLFRRDHLHDGYFRWKTNLPSNIDEYLQKMKSKHRYWLRRMNRLLEKEHPGKVTFKYFRDKGQVNQLCNDAEQIAKKTYQRGLSVGFIDNIENRRRMILSAERGWLRAYILYVDDQPCAFWIGTLYGKTFYLDFTGYDPNYRKYEPGTILFVKMVQDLSENSVAEEIDFGAGDAFYKRRFGEFSQKHSDVILFSPTWFGIGMNLMRTLTILSSRLAEQTLTRLNLRDKFKKLWRTHLASKETKP
ncbi:MAG: GNAT family N-acetyltransferase [Candidatus Hodarchaeota archaeon]